MPSPAVPPTVKGLPLPGGLPFGTLYQRTGGSAALWRSAGGMLAAVCLWLVVTRGETRG